jgi:hypothetical protein
MFWWKRYEPLLEAKARPAKDVLIELLAKELVEMCQTFPPAENQIEWEDPALRRRLEGRVHELPKCDPALVDEVSRLIVWDLGHEPEAIDHYFRNDVYGDAAPTPAHVDAIHVLWRVGTDILLARKEEAQTLLKRKDLIEAASQLPAIFRRRFSTIWMPEVGEA